MLIMVVMRHYGFKQMVKSVSLRQNIDLPAVE